MTSTSLWGLLSSLFTVASQAPALNQYVVQGLQIGAAVTQGAAGGATLSQEEEAFLPVVLATAVHDLATKESAKESAASPATAPAPTASV